MPPTKKTEQAAGSQPPRAPAPTPEQLELLYGEEDVVGDFLRELANRRLRSYAAIIQTGGKAGQSYLGHVLDLVLLVARLHKLIPLEDDEQRVLSLAAVIHDLNKVPPYDGRGAPRAYVDIVTRNHVAAELERLEADAFFPDWHDYLTDIVMVAHVHQANLAQTAIDLDRRRYRDCRLTPPRIEALGRLLRAADTLAVSHRLDETRKKGQALDEINRLVPASPQRWITHRVAEQRGLLTNVIHNCVIQRIQELAGAIDLLYYPDGVAYLVPRDGTLSWTVAEIGNVARLVRHRVAALQRKEIGRFIRPAPWGIDVDAAALESGATDAEIFEVVAARALAKRYSADSLAVKAGAVAQDARKALDANRLTPAAASWLQQGLDADSLVPSEPERQRLGELAMAYVKYLEKHRSADLRRTGRGAEERVYAMLGLPAERWPAYEAINSYRRGYVLAGEIALSFEGLLAALLRDSADLAPDSGTSSAPEEASALDRYVQEAVRVQAGAADIGAFREHLSRYTDGKAHRQCCACSSSAPTEEWMSASAPPSIGVQLFSNRLEGGSAREPKRNLCPVCRTQFILEKLAWPSHRDKQGSEFATFYLHLYPYSFFTRPLLVAWYGMVERLRREDHGSFFVKTDDYFRSWYEEGYVPVQRVLGGTMGVGLPTFSEALGNTPVLPYHARGRGYGVQFLTALETAVVLARFFGARVLLSRVAVPVVDLSEMEDVVLFVEGVPRNLSWLVNGSGGQGALSQADGARLFDRLRHLHALKQRLWTMGDDRDIVSLLATAGADDRLGLFAVADRLLEAKGRGSHASDWATVADAREMLPHLLAITGMADV